ncbi:MAG: phosphoglucosamine mutase [Bifidobacteriaceae bacterium]|jgi:phosphoglucosamine mutase|nr:phosphoglucosamine mutase [Bifidobacteriaceae bacterium]
MAVPHGAPKTRLFGTDGVRGLVGRDITADLALKLSAAAARELEAAQGLGYGATAAPPVRDHRQTSAPKRLRGIVGVDSRVSGDMLAAASAAGLASAGVDAVLAGVLPTPGLAYLTRSMGFDLGVMISASHNPYQDNGIKFFSGTGYKLPDAVEDAIEARLVEKWEPAVGERVGVTRTDLAAVESYINFLTETAPVSLDGMRVVLDCANGAAWAVAPEVFRRLGAEVTSLGVQPNGTNINSGVGSTHPERLQRAVVGLEAHAGFAFDGDADRCLAVDSGGQMVDGDMIMGILALALRDRGELAADSLVATVMSNLGLFKAMEKANIAVKVTPVGDRYVLEEMVRGGYVLGGEQSGHVIMSRHTTTGDGTLTAIQLACQVRFSGSTLGELASAVPVFPQVLINVREVDKSRVGTDPAVLAALAEAEAELGEAGRVLLRASGTEPLVRVMVEAATNDQAQAVAERLAEVVARQLDL